MDKEEYLVRKLGSLLDLLRLEARSLFNVADDLYKAFCETLKIPYEDITKWEVNDECSP